MASTASRPPFTRFTTPGGQLAGCRAAANTFCIVSGTRSEGLTMTVLPQASAYGRNQNGIMPGKLNGAMIARDAERLADHHLVDAGCDVLGVVALDHRRGAARHLDVLDGAAHLAARFDQRLAGLHRDGAREVLDVLLEQRLQLEQILDALADRNPPPCRESAGRGPRRLLDFRGRRQRRAAELFTGRRVDAPAAFRSPPRRPLALRCSCAWCLFLLVSG